jgi:putative nucleotidyltransferase with HDIG domain
MKLETAFLRSKVAYRIFVLFILCALLPIAVLAALSFTHVKGEITEQSRIRLRQSTKTTGLAIYERLLFLEDEMKLLASGRFLASSALNKRRNGILENLLGRLNGIAVSNEAGHLTHLFGRIPDPPPFTTEQKKHIQSGKTVVMSQVSGEDPARVWIGRAVDPSEPRLGIILGQINTQYLWDSDNVGHLPPTAEFCILDGNHILFRSPDFPPLVSEPLMLAVRQSGVGQMDINYKGEQYLASYWSLFLERRFLAPKWTVVLSQSKGDFLAPMDQFKKVFVPVILASLFIVLFVSIVQIRRSLIPLEKLREGTKRIAGRDFESRVSIESGDEFEDLAASFNAMATRLGNQFKALTTMNDIDRAILSTLETRKIIDTLLTRAPDVIRCSSVGVLLMNGKSSENEGVIHFRYARLGGRIETAKVILAPEEMRKLRETSESLLIQNKEVPGYLVPLAKEGEKSFLIFPILLKEKLSALVAVGYASPADRGQDDLSQVRQLADQMAVALSNARLIEELNHLNLSILTALARTIDAKSPWTGGHSERVTKLALEIGKALHLGPGELDMLHRAGLLHDAGKIGTPAEILDKPGRLTEEETRLMHEHVRTGVRILEPIPACADILPIVLQHHECFDGSGYPDRISGEAISLGARIFAVADYFDALISDRPYRPGMDREQVIESIRQEAGAKFDPGVVKAFLRIMGPEETKGEV